LDLEALDRFATIFLAIAILMFVSSVGYRILTVPVRING